MKTFTAPLTRLLLRRKMTNDIPVKSAQLCSNCSRSLTTTSSLPAPENNKVEILNNSKNNNVHESGFLPAKPTIEQAPSSSTTLSSTTANDGPSSTEAANATAAFQDLLGLNNDSNSDLKNTFYQRELPSTLVRFSSSLGKSFFRSSMEANHAEGFFPLTGNFTTQSEPAYCGPSSRKTDHFDYPNPLYMHTH
jgi:hypothetical protein